MHRQKNGQANLHHLIFAKIPYPTMNFPEAAKNQDICLFSIPYLEEGNYINPLPFD